MNIYGFDRDPWLRSLSRGRVEEELACNDLAAADRVRIQLARGVDLPDALRAEPSVRIGDRVVPRTSLEALSGQMKLKSTASACRSSHEPYDRALARHYTDYFALHPDEAGEQAWSAKSFGAALPQGWGHLSGLIPPVVRHGERLSGKSSQALILGIRCAPPGLDALPGIAA